VNDGEVICIDAGAKFGGYCADVTRTFPANGTFSKRQRQLYDLVFEALEAAIAAVKPGKHLFHADDAARAVLRKGGVEDKYVHGIGHQLGMEVHDVTPDDALQAGMVVTIEPGVYLPEEKIGIRIEDDILVTAKGNRNLTGSLVPRKAREVERAMRG
jgi:Xaa-Pro aminopeptidase